MAAFVFGMTAMVACGDKEEGDNDGNGGNGERGKDGDDVCRDAHEVIDNARDAHPHNGDGWGQHECRERCEPTCQIDQPARGIEDEKHEKH